MGKTDEASLMRQNQEMLMVYKKYNFNPLSSCLVSFIQLPLLNLDFNFTPKTIAEYKQIYEG